MEHTPGKSRRDFLIAGMVALPALHTRAFAMAEAANASEPLWTLDATTIEACACTFFYTCYCSVAPRGHVHGSMVDHGCRFYSANLVNKGNFGDVRLDGLKFWLASDFGVDRSKGADRAELRFERSVTKQQRDAITNIVPHAYAVKRQSFTVGQDALIEWSTTREYAEAMLDGGTAEELVLRRNPCTTENRLVASGSQYFVAARDPVFIRRG
jgi:hypothetical protein